MSVGNSTNLLLNLLEFNKSVYTSLENSVDTVFIILPHVTKAEEM